MDLQIIMKTKSGDSTPVLTGNATPQEIEHAKQQLKEFQNQMPQHEFILLINGKAQ